MITSDKPNVLYVDDEINNLTSFKAVFRRLYNVFTADSAAEGLKILQEQKIHVIITDQRMPGILDIFTLNIINYYKNNRDELQISAINFEPFLNQLIADIKLNQNTSMVEFKIYVAQNGEFYSDKFRIGLVINNLISNAINYSNKKEEKTNIEIGVFIKNDSAEIKVNDNGVGIPTEHLDHIFEMFYRASEESKGSGLGLYIVKEAINKLKGNIEVNSTAGIGTTFNINIPSQQSM